MILLTFSHPLTSNQITQAEALTHQTIDQVIVVPVQLDHQRLSCQKWVSNKSRH
jgi:hypothetical protein